MLHLFHPKEPMSPGEGKMVRKAHRPGRRHPAHDASVGQPVVTRAVSGVWEQTVRLLVVNPGGHFPEVRSWGVQFMPPTLHFLI